MQFPLPDVGEGLADVEIVSWFVEVGDRVREDDPLVEVETDKALVQITTPVTGHLVRQGGQPGERVEVGAILAEFEVDERASPTDARPSDAEPSDAADVDTQADGGSVPAPPVASIAGDSDTPRTGPKPRATPATRGLARRLGVDLHDVDATGTGGRIVDADVERAAEDGGPAPDAAVPTAAAAVPATPAEPVAPRVLEDRVVALGGVRRAIADTMTTSWESIPQVSSFHEIDMGRLSELRADLSSQGSGIPLTAFLVLAAARALRDFPELNATVGEGEIQQHGHVHVGVAMDSDEGVVAPVVTDADRRSVGDIGRQLRSLADQVADRSITPAQMRGATFTVNNYGPLGGWFGTSLVTPSQVGILSFGPTRDQVVPVHGQPGVRPIAVMNLAADHRVADGRGLIGYCLAVRHQLEQPLTLLVEA